MATKAYPKNFRTNAYHLFDRGVKVAGLAGPHNNGEDHRWVYQFLKGHDFHMLIGLHDEHDFTKEAQSENLDYHYIKLDDFAQDGIPPEKIAEIISVIEEQVSQGRNVAIHCGTGNGRTGLIMAALKLIEIYSMAIKGDASLLDEDITWKEGAIVEAKMTGQRVPTTRFIKEAVETIRKESVGNALEPHAGEAAVETLADLMSLLNYQKNLQEELRPTLNSAPGL